jgi:mono/diheme cytochrome c family protein
METPVQKNRALAKTFFLIVLALVAGLIIYSATHPAPWSWPVPEEAKQLKNPLQPSPTALDAAKKIYLDKCANCHGEGGKGDGRDAARYDPQPADFTDPKRMAGVTDGELFYKISEGKKPMPVFKTKLTEDDRWRLVLLIRSFASPQTNSSTSR